HVLMIVHCPDDQLDRSFLHQVGDVDAEGRVAALVVRHALPVEPHGRGPVDRVEPEPDPLPAPLLWQLEGPRVPADTLVGDPRDAGAWGFGGEGHLDRLAQLRLGAEWVVTPGERPGSVQRSPTGPSQGGPGVLARIYGAGIVQRHTPADSMLMQRLAQLKPFQPNLLYNSSNSKVGYEQCQLAAYRSTRMARRPQGPEEPLLAASGALMC